MSREMKHSGVPWIGEIPKEWNVGKVKNFYRFFTGFTPDTKNESYYDNENGIPWATISDLSGKYIETTKGGISQLYINQKFPMLIPKGSLLYSFKLSVGQVARTKIELYTNEAIAAFLPEDEVSLDYLYYSSQVCIIENANENIYGAKLLNQELINNAIILYPPLSDQQKIAEFLDKKCGEVDEMIALQEQIIEELKAYKQSVITEAVTKGLNPNVTMNDSGIEWIGEIPEHWEIKKIKHLSHVVRGGSPRPAGDLRYYVGNIPFMKVADITKDDKIYVDKCEYTIKEAGLSHTRMIKPNTLLLTNSGATLGVPKINTFDTTFNDGIAAFLNLDISLDIIFAYYSLKARTQYFIDSASLGIGQPNLNTDIIGSTYLLVPPIYEQQIIVDFLNEKCADVDALISIKQRKIESLKEYKKSIIYEYVTGKKEVK